MPRGPGRAAASPSADTGSPRPTIDASGCDNQANAATMMNPHVTRRRATRSAYGFGKSSCGPCCSGQLVAPRGSVPAPQTPDPGVISRMLASGSARPAIRGHRVGTAQHRDRSSVGSMTRRIGRPVNRHARLPERRRQMQRTAIQPYHRRRSPRGMDQARRCSTRASGRPATCSGCGASSTNGIPHSRRNRSASFA